MATHAVTRERLIALAERYLGELERMGALPCELDEDVLIVPGVSQDVLRDHLAWRCEHVRELVAARDDVRSAGRWIGFIQGALWAMGAFSIEDMRRHEVEVPPPAGDAAASRPGPP